MKKALASLAVAVSTLIVHTPVRSQQPITPVLFKPFIDGRNWILGEVLTYKMGISQDSITDPVASSPTLRAFLQRDLHSAKD